MEENKNITVEPTQVEPIKIETTKEQLIQPIFSFNKELFDKLDDKNKKRVIDEMILWCKIHKPGFSLTKLKFILSHGL